MEFVQSGEELDSKTRQKRSVMTRVVTLQELQNELICDLLADLNRRRQARGEDVEIVFERPKPRLVVEGEVVQLKHGE
jgi:hypothetical protein